MYVALNPIFSCWCVSLRLVDEIKSLYAGESLTVILKVILITELHQGYENTKKTLKTIKQLLDRRTKLMISKDH